MKDKNLPKISIVIAALNSENVLKPCLKSISEQNYPKNKIELIIVDGGSTDNTVKIAKKYGAKIEKNKLMTGESGKALGVKKSKGELIALVDSDNILPTPDWLTEMVEPLLKHPKAVGSEPWAYTWRKRDGFIARYCALIGMNDPFVHFLGNYDRQNLLTGTWTEVPHDEKDYPNYVLAKFDKRGLPTIGANGVIFRAGFLKENLARDYLFDIDILANHIKRKKSVTFIKVKNGIIHTFCESSIPKFAKKQRRRVKDFLYHRWEVKDRVFDWYSMDITGPKPWGSLKFILYCVLVFPLIFQSIRGYIKKRDVAWFFHPLACEITLWEYGWGRIIGVFTKSEISRKGWSQ